MTKSEGNGELNSGVAAISAMTLDARGLACPLPILKARKALGQLSEGQILEVLATEPHSVADFEAFCGMSGHKLLARDVHGSTFRFLIRKGKSSKPV